MDHYPIKFVPILKNRIWGGSKLKNYLGKELSDLQTGESWEISTVEGSISVVSDGVFKGKQLDELLELYPEDILGTDIYKKFGINFPLLFKFIDAREDLSIQIHPNDQVARERHNSFGKTEMWYVIQADPGSRLIIGFKGQLTRQDYLKALQEDRLPELLEEIPVQSGDVFFVEPGTVHAIGAGILLAEIQQSSDITYRLYDWKRKEANGTYRELHTDLALDTINFRPAKSRISYSKVTNKANRLIECPYFTTRFIPVKNTFVYDKPGDFFSVLMCVSGEGEIMSGEKRLKVQKGETFLIPAALKQLSITGESGWLEVYVS